MTAMIVVRAALLLGLVAAGWAAPAATAVESEPFFDLSGFHGKWRGTMVATCIGPYDEDQALTITIQPTSEPGGLLTTHYFDAVKSPIITGSVQQFWISQKNNSMVYCGDLRNFFSSDQSAQVATVYQPYDFFRNESSSKNLKFCMRPGGCAAMTKTVTLHNSTHLTIFATFAGATHAKIEAVRVGDLDNTMAKPPPPCTLNISSPTATNKQPSTKCPYSHDNKGVASLAPGPSYKPTCYHINEVTGYTIASQLHPVEKKLDVTISAKVSPTGWIAIGFYPQFPFMQGADVALAYQTAGGQTCVRPMYAAQPFGTPADNPDFELSNTKVAYDGKNGILTFSFTRPLETGHTPIPVTDKVSPLATQFIWAIGEEGTAPTDCTGAPGYHGMLRGYRAINWANPTVVIPDYRKCAE